MVVWVYFIRQLRTGLPLGLDPTHVCYVHGCNVRIWKGRLQCVTVKLASILGAMQRRGKWFYRFGTYCAFENTLSVFCGLFICFKCTYHKSCKLLTLFTPIVFTTCASIFVNRWHLNRLHSVVDKICTVIFLCYICLFFLCLLFLFFLLKKNIA